MNKKTSTELEEALLAVSSEGSLGKENRVRHPMP